MGLFQYRSELFRTGNKNPRDGTCLRQNIKERLEKKKKTVAGKQFFALINQTVADVWFHLFNGVFSRVVMPASIFLSSC